MKKKKKKRTIERTNETVCFDLQNVKFARDKRYEVNEKKKIVIKRRKKLN